VRNKKSGCPTQLNSHYVASTTPKRRNKKHGYILHRTAKFYKVVFAAGLIAIAFTAGAAFGSTMTEPQIVLVEREVVVPEQVIYPLSDAERREVASVVQAEAGGEPYAGKVAVAQCIFQAVKDDGILPSEAVKKYGYTKNRPEPSAEALDAVNNVFEKGHTVTSEPIKYFYAPAIVSSRWHESQNYVITINNHRFFAEK